MDEAEKAVDLLELLGASVEVLAHESEHLNGSSDEGATECLALAVLPKFLRAEFAVTTAAAQKTAMRGAWARHRAAEQWSAAYRGPSG